MKRIPLFLGALFAITSLRAEPPQAPFPFVLPWDDASPSVVNMSGLFEKPAGSHGFVVAKDGHFFEGAKRIRFFGVNTAFGANFPTHEDATKIAARMAKFGINCVRFHHMDSCPAPGGIMNRDMRTLDPAQLDKLDFFIAQLKANGIYANLNLHVSRTYPGMPTWKGAPGYFKGVDLFYPPMIEMQREHARNLLQHVNPYTKTAYADEPAVAIVEINNEDGLICEWWGKSFDNMPDPYRAELSTQWNRWLQAKYPSLAALQKAWDTGKEPLGAEMLHEGGFASGLGGAWFLEHNEGAEAEASKIADPPFGAGVRIVVKKPGSAGWHVQLSQGKIALTQGQTYTLSFRANTATKEPRRIRVSASQAHAPWESFWSTEVELTPDPAGKAYHFTFKPTGSDQNARIIFTNLSVPGGDFRFTDVSLRPGGILGLQDGEQLGAVSPFKKREFAARTISAQRDWMRFLWETEEGYWTGMQRFLKQEIKTHSVIVGTATGFSPVSIQAKLDAVDIHAYWQHPSFPKRQWDLEDWTVNNISMAGAPDGGTLSGLALRRVAGKPYLCTEYNAPAPNSYSAETFLLVNAFAAFQDWDGVFAFAYSHRTDDWNTQHIINFFDIDQHPAKMATLPAAVAMFVRGDVAKAGATTTVAVPQEKALESCLWQGSWWTAKEFGIGKTAWMTSATAIDTGEPSVHPPIAQPQASGTPEIIWDNAKSYVLVNSPRSKAFIGKGTGGPVTLGSVTIVTPPEWASIALTAMDGRDFQSPGRILITAVGNIENTGMRWKSAEKNSVGRNWGKAPTLAWGVAAGVTLPVPASKLRAWALDDRGQRKKEIAVKPTASGGFLELGTQHQTLWYEVEVRP